MSGRSTRRRWHSCCCSRSSPARASRRTSSAGAWPTRQLRRSHAELEQKVVERTERLAEREREHLQILEDSPSPIVVLRLADAALDYGNPAFLALLGIERGAVAGSSAEQLFVDPSHVRSILAALRQHGHAEGEVRLRAAGGRELDGLMAARVTRFAGEPAVIASLVDITERKQWELALADSRQRYRQLFEAESDAILLIENATGRIIEANAAAARLYGYTRRRAARHDQRPALRRARGDAAGVAIVTGRPGQRRGRSRCGSIAAGTGR